jgi:hypothetical protein
MLYSLSLFHSFNLIMKQNEYKQTKNKTNVVIIINCSNRCRVLLCFSVSFLYYSFSLGAFFSKGSRPNADDNIIIIIMIIRIRFAGVDIAFARLQN